MYVYSCFFELSLVWFTILNLCPQVMQIAHQYLASRRKASDNPRVFRKQLYDLWFKPYQRTRGSRCLDSSAFEHVFVGETRGGTEVLGFHNWIQFYVQEKAGNVDYQGYILGTKVSQSSQLVVYRSRCLCFVQLKWFLLVALCVVQLF